MSTTNGGEAWLFHLPNIHSAESGTPPHIDDLRHGQYLGHFENDYGEQALFVYERDSSQAVLYLGVRHANIIVIGSGGWASRRILSRYQPDE